MVTEQQGSAPGEAKMGSFQHPLRTKLPLARRVSPVDRTDDTCAARVSQNYRRGNEAVSGRVSTAELKRTTFLLQGETKRSIRAARGCRPHSVHPVYEPAALTELFRAVFSRTANFRAIATFAIPRMPRRNFKRRQFRRLTRLIVKLLEQGCGTARFAMLPFRLLQICLNLGLPTIVFSP